MRPALACLLLVGLGLACAAVRMPRAPVPCAIAVIESAPPVGAPSIVTIADAPKTSPPG